MQRDFCSGHLSDKQDHDHGKAYKHYHHSSRRNMKQVNLFFVGLFAVTGGFLAEVTAKGISMINEPHPVPRGAVSKARRSQRPTQHKPYVSIFDMR